MKLLRKKFCAEILQGNSSKCTFLKIQLQKLQLSRRALKVNTLLCLMGFTIGIGGLDSNGEGKVHWDKKATTKWKNA